MDFLKKKSSSDDDDIIELTDIIEKGTEDKTAKSSLNQAMETQMDSLFGRGNSSEQPIVPDDMDADIDALLADMEPTGSPKAATPPLNVDEELDMPNMAEVDALLKNMDIPPQPSDIRENTLPSAADGESLDDLLDGLLDNAGNAPAGAKPAAAPNPPATAAEAVNTAPAEKSAASPASATSVNDLDDLDALFAEAVSPKAAASAPAAPAPAPSGNDLDDLDALFAEAVSPKSAASAPAAPAPAPSGNDLDDLDALFAEAVSPKAAASAPAAPAPAPSGNDLDDLDALFVEAVSPKAAASAPAAPAPAPSGNDLDDLDALFASNAPTLAAATPPAAPTKAPASKASPQKDIIDDKHLSLDDALDALLGDPSAPPSAPKTQRPEASAVSPTLPAPEAIGNDLDDLLADLAPPKAAAPSAPPAAAPASTATSAAHPQKDKLNDKELSLDDALDALLGGAAATAAPAPASKQAAKADVPPASATAGNELDDLDALFANNALDSVQKPSAPATDNAPVPPATDDSSARFQSIEDDLDDILGSVTPGSEPVPTSANTLDDEAVDLSDLDTMNADEEEDFLADIFDTEKNDKKKSSAFESDLLEGLDVLDGLDDPIQPEETIVTPPAPSAVPSPAMQATSINTDTLDFSMFSPNNPAEMPFMPDTPDTPGEDFSLPELDELDKLLQEAPAASAPATEQPEEFLLAGAEAPLPNPFVQDFTEEDVALAAQELLDEKVREAASIDNVDTDAWLSSLDAILEEEGESDADSHHSGGTEKILPPEDASVNLDNLLAHLSDTGEQSHYVYSPQMARNSHLGTTNTASPVTSPCDPTVPSMPFDLAYEQELARLQQITDRFASSLVEADARIATLTQQAKSEIALETLFRADSPFSASLQHAVGSAVAAELRTHSNNIAAAPDAAHNAAQSAALADAHQQLQAEHKALTEKILLLEEQVQGLQNLLEAEKSAQQATLERLSALEDGNKEARLQTVETHVKGQAASTEELEAQCKQLAAQLEAQNQHQANFEQHFQQEVEKAAAAAAARIIREEIAGILAGQE